YGMAIEDFSRFTMGRWPAARPCAGEDKRRSSRNGRVPPLAFFPPHNEAPNREGFRATPYLAHGDLRQLRPGLERPQGILNRRRGAAVFRENKGPGSER